MNQLKQLPFDQVFIRHFSNELQLRQEFILFFVLEGSLQLNIYEKSYVLQPHDIIFINSYEVHSVSNASPDIHVMALFFQPDYIAAACPDLHTITFCQHHIPYSDTDELYINLCKSLADIIFHTIKSDSTATLITFSSGYHILIQLIEHLSVSQNTNSSKTDYTQQQISQILNYLNTNYAENITLASAAAVLNFHPQYFSVFFKKHFQINFVNYLNILRVNKSLASLTTTDMSITEIALSHGFSSHNTYSTAFRKIHGISPSMYRKERALSNNYIAPVAPNMNYLSFFKKYQGLPYGTMINLQNQFQHITYDFSSCNMQATTPNKFPNIGFSLGHASTLLNTNTQKQILENQKELQITNLRLLDIFSDDLFVYYENELKEITISWSYVDMILDFLQELNIRPCIEIGYTPEALASKKQHPRVIYHPNVSMPKSLKKWSALVTDFIQHLIARYGRKQILTWNFDFWTLPDLDVPMGFWNESIDDFFLFYRVAYFAMKNVEPDLRIGSPCFSIPDGLKWYDAFFQYCKKYDMMPSYMATRLFNCSSNLFSSIENTSELYVTEKLVHTDFSRHATIENLESLHSILKKHSLKKMEIVVSQWNLSYIPKDYLRDTCFMANYILHTMIHGQCLMSSIYFHSLSDITEDKFVDHSPFHGSSGLLTFHGLKKASYYAFFLLKKMGDTYLDAGDNYLLTKSNNSIQLLLFNYVTYQTPQPEKDTLVIHSLLPLAPGDYQIKETRLNPSNGSAYDLWMKFNKPEILDSDTLSYFNRCSYPEISFTTATSNGTLLLDTTVAAHEAVLIEIEPIFK